MSTIYTPTGCKTLNELGDGQVRLGIQSAPFMGKTSSALTFPNPVIASFDRKTSAHSHRTDVINVPFYEPAFCDTIAKRTGLKNPPNRKEALLLWCQTEALKLSTEQTLVLDGSTGIEEAFHQQYWLEPVYTTTGAVNDFAEWNLKKEYFGELCTALKALPCNVVYICHETADRDKKGELNGKIKPLLTGQFGDKLGGNFTDWFSMETMDKPVSLEQKKKLMEWGRIDTSTLEEWIASTPANHDTIYLWQTQADSIRNCGTTSLYNCPKYVVADYKSFDKYRRK